MALVDYSDSEGSEGEEGPPQAENPKSTTKETSQIAGAKSGFQKVVDKSNPHRIRVELPSIAIEGTKEEGQNGEERPAKRAKTSSAFGGFNSFLPAPKNANKAGSSTAPNGLLKGRATGLKQGISLKTGAAPAFSRELPTEPEQDGGWEAGEDLSLGAPSEEQEQEDHNNQEHSLPVLKEATKLAVKPMMFKPLSVGKKNPKKKKPPSQDYKDNIPSAGSQLAEDQRKTAPTNSVSVASKPKKSLFSSVEYEASDISLSASNGSYEPLLEGLDETSENHDDQEQRYPRAAPTFVGNPQTSTQPSDLNALADSLGLTPAQRRQLFGRNSTAKGTEVAHFSVSAEYSSNNSMNASEANAAPAHNPVRSIAPGKHSLQQLLNAAASQKDALEESFATGKRNKADAGSRYGW